MNILRIIYARKKKQNKLLHLFIANQIQEHVRQ